MRILVGAHSDNACRKPTFAEAHVRAVLGKKRASTTEFCGISASLELTPTVSGQIPFLALLGFPSWLGDIILHGSWWPRSHVAVRQWASGGGSMCFKASLVAYKHDAAGHGLCLRLGPLPAVAVTTWVVSSHWVQGTLARKSSGCVLQHRNDA